MGRGAPQKLRCHNARASGGPENSLLYFLRLPQTLPALSPIHGPDNSLAWHGPDNSLAWHGPASGLLIMQCPFLNAISPGIQEGNWE